MGLSIHYSGSFNKNASLTEMIEEVRDVAEIYKWKYNIYESQFPVNSLNETVLNNNIYGISFSPPGCESVFLSFLSNGKLCYPFHLKYYHDSSGKYQKYIYIISIKTQYAGFHIHMLLVHLLKYLSKKYFKEFSVCDEGQYWESNDENLVRKNFNHYNQLLGMVSSALENFSIRKNESFEEYFQKVVRKISGKKEE